MKPDRKDVERELDERRDEERRQRGGAMPDEATLERAMETDDPDADGRPEAERGVPPRGAENPP